MDRRLVGLCPLVGLALAKACPARLRIDTIVTLPIPILVIVIIVVVVAPHA